MNCAICKSGDHRVVDTVEIAGAIRRRRECGECRNRWTTFERIEDTRIVSVETTVIAAIRDSLSSLITGR